MDRFYITTPIYYVNDKPHLGSAYTTVNADVLHRYHRWFGFESLFLTGLDEHGQKVQKAALDRGLEPQQHCDQMAEHFKQVWQQLNIDCDIFFRTTHPEHKQAVQQCLQQLYDKGDIFESTYEGWYCVADETFHTEKELVNGLSPSGRKVEKIVEKNYFFKMSAYQQKLIDFYTANFEAVQPAHRRNEVLGFLKQPLQDLCISRPKSRLQWGIELPFDSDYVTYVWFDALLNYATAIDLQSTLPSQTPKQKASAEDNKNSQFVRGRFQDWWPVAHHLVGKDILMTHAIYWPCMLMALGIPPARVVFAHGWLLNKQNEKMSKSKGDVMRPEFLSSLIGVDALRYYLVKAVVLGSDSPISTDLVLSTVNTDLANTLGNLLSRVTKLVHKYFDGQMPAPQKSPVSSEEVQLQAHALQLPSVVRENILKLKPHLAVGEIIKTLELTNPFLENQAPWKLAKTDLPAAGHVLATVLEVLRIAGLLLQPVMPQKSAELLCRLSVTDLSFEAARKWGQIPTSSQILQGPALFPRVQLPDTDVS